jgi:diguanylate cyclase (GGDEF)-like protein
MSTTTNSTTLLVLIAGLCLLASVAWLLLARLRRFAPQAALTMAAVNVLLCLGIVLYVQRGQPGWPDVVAFEGSALLLMGGFALMAAFGPVIAHEAPQWRAPALAYAGAATLLWILPPYSSWWLASSGSGMAVLNLIIAVEAYRRLRRAVSLGWTLLLISPYALLALMFGLRGLGAVLLPPDQLSLLHQSGANALWLWTGFLMALLINTQVAFLLVLRLVLRLRQLTRVDPLTGALNRRAFETALQAAHAAFARGTPYALVVIDMDHFKRLNDELGHAAGDAALRLLVEQVRPLLREVDAIARLGGEEFALLLHGADSAGAALVAERIRLQLHQLDWQWQGRSWALSASFGVAEWRPGDAGPEAVLARADAALYQAKRLGRDLVC